MQEVRTRIPQEITATVAYLYGKTRAVYGIITELDQNGNVGDAKVAFVPEQSIGVFVSDPLQLEAAQRAFIEMFEREFVPLDVIPFFHWSRHYQYDKPGLAHAYENRWYGDERKWNGEKKVIEKITVVLAQPELKILERALTIICSNALGKE